ncbi:MAG: type 4a pilus biogenesis protein PilO [Gammaproteobacteria bacterium]|nr:type 4a pilus biogenesis protein PilO [Gammaproteobacteria bacterium]
MNLSELTLDNIGSWPIAARVSVVSFVCGIIFLLFFTFDIKPTDVKIAQAESTENDLRSSFQVKYSQVINRGNYAQQVSALNHQIHTILAALPNQLNVPELLADMSRAGTQNGLQFNFIKPLSEVKHAYYIELPIEISVNGNYEQLTEFVTALAKIPHIVTIDKFSIVVSDTPNTPNDTNALPNSQLTMELTAVTYKQNSKKTSQPPQTSVKSP